MPINSVTFSTRNIYAQITPKLFLRMLCICCVCLGAIKEVWRLFRSRYNIILACSRDLCGIIQLPEMENSIFAFHWNRGGIQLYYHVKVKKNRIVENCNWLPEKSLMHKHTGNNQEIPLASPKKKDVYMKSYIEVLYFKNRVNLNRYEHLLTSISILV